VETWLQQQRPYLTPQQLQKTGRRLHQATGGNPLFLTELLQALPEASHLPDPLPVPASVRELVQRRLHTLPQISQDVLKSLAVWDAPAPFALVQQISGTPETETIL